MTVTADEAVTVEGLRAYRGVLAAQLQETETKLRLVNAALLALGGSQSRTLDLVRACVAEVGEVDAREALTYLVAHGWQPEARGNPLNAVRTALAHLAKWGEIERVSRGVYRLAEAPSREAV
jgi:hypothetical protein